MRRAFFALIVGSMLVGCDAAYDPNVVSVINPVCWLFCRVEQASTAVGNLPENQNLTLDNAFSGGGGAQVSRSVETNP